MTTAQDIHGGSGHSADQHSSAGTVSIGSATGADASHTDASHDLFVFGDSTGMTSLDGSHSGNWTSVVELDVSSSSHAAATSGDWTHQISSPDHGAATGTGDGVNTTPPPDDPHGSAPGTPHVDPIHW